MSLENNFTGFDACDIAENEAGYNYYGYTKADGAWKVLREKTDGTEFRIAAGKEDYSTNFAARSGLDYKRPDQLPRV
jgi:hypothetical protein